MPSVFFECVGGFYQEFSLFKSLTGRRDAHLKQLYNEIIRTCIFLSVNRNVLLLIIIILTVLKVNM